MTNLVNIVKGTTHPINVNILSGTAPYIFKIHRANGYDITDPASFQQIETTYIGTISETYHQFKHLFEETEGNYTIKGGIDDSCLEGSKSDSEIINVNVYIPILISISITPTSSSINVGITKQLTAICKDQANNTITCPILTWNSSDNTIATVDSSGKVTGIAPGNVNITVSYGSIISNISAIAVYSPVTNLLANSGFENSLPTNWTTAPPNSYSYPEIGRDGTGKCVAIDFGSSIYSGKSSWAQTITINPSTIYTLSGYMRLENVIGSGTSIIIDWKTSSGSYISSSTIITKTGTIGWTKFSGTITSPSNAYKAIIILQLKNSSGKVYFDDVSFYK